MNALVCVLVMSLLVESVWETLKLVWEKGFDWQRVAIILLSIGVCIAYNLDLISMVGISSNIPVIGMILTGILSSRGANFVNDIFTKVYKLRKNG